MKKTYVSKTEMAQAYFPYIAPHSALNKLMSIIQSSDRLLTQLREADYNPQAKLLSPRQVEIIMERLGNPFC